MVIPRKAETGGDIVQLTFCDVKECLTIQGAGGRAWSVAAVGPTASYRLSIHGLRFRSLVGWAAPEARRRGMVGWLVRWS